MASCKHLETSARSGIRKEWVALTQAQGAKDASWNVCSTCLGPETRYKNGKWHQLHDKNAQCFLSCSRRGDGLGFMGRRRRRVPL